MQTEQTCPYCKKIHYSTYNAERCAARSEAKGMLARYSDDERIKKPGHAKITKLDFNRDNAEPNSGLAT